MLERIFAGTGAVSALFASTCCVLPLGLGAAGLGGAWLSAFSFFGSYQWIFQIVAILALGSGFWLVYGRGRGSTSTRPTRVLLWAGAGTLALVLTVPWWQGLLG